MISFESTIDQGAVDPREPMDYLAWKRWDEAEFRDGLNIAESELVAASSILDGTYEMMMSVGTVEGGLADLWMAVAGAIRGSRSIVEGTYRIVSGANAFVGRIPDGELDSLANPVIRPTDAEYPLADEGA